jgi:hypothetical protein
MRFAAALALLWLAYAVGAAALDESVQVMGADGAADLRGMLIAGFGGAHVMLLVACAWALAADWFRDRR